MQYLPIFILKAESVYAISLQEIRIAGIHHFRLLEHLAHNNLDVLIVDFHAIEAIDLLDLVHQILLDLTGPLDPQNIVRIDRSFGKPLSGHHPIAGVHSEVLSIRDQVLPFLPDSVGPFVAADHKNLAGATGYTAHAHCPVYFRNHSRFLRAAGL